MGMGRTERARREEVLLTREREREREKEHINKYSQLGDNFRRGR